MNFPNDVVVDASGNVYIADSNNHRVRRVAPNGVITTVAGAGFPGFYDDQGTFAEFNNPQGVAVDASGNIYVADTGNHSIRKIDTGGNVTTIAGDGTSGFVNGNGANARFNSPRGVALDNLGRIFVADTGNHAVRRIDTNGAVTTVAGDGTAGSTDSPNARFNGLAGIAVDGAQIYVYLADTNNHRIRRLDGSNTVITLAGAERYVTPELKEHEARVLGAEERLRSLEAHLFDELLDAVAARPRDPSALGASGPSPGTRSESRLPGFPP